ncbi:hypothetical protein ASPVEDRAFT_90064 [Aspergillus versicolor CBS 583.65]|uniref:EthD domain-containing protein n=1 Tax=Aspergillus versicolor CBS 583.65 TaxID=1036611 RepID=A0A1L9Q520_ASPVE|nr:uncharacterized protein ASPVEDRAFT_90064 [Aspergillus versicolor CBS 583.65]OJJ08857.1 hypothetical protein ASPVEDRAFT_90064 [Aspergillus versicolor CBS 583.65]
MAEYQTTALLYILVSPGSKTAGDVSTWLNSPLIRNLPGLKAATEYNAIDEQKPEFLAVYELTHPSAVQLSSLESTAASSGFEVELRIYKIFSAKTSPHYNAPPGRIFRTLGLQPGPAMSEDAYNAWYEQEHVPLLSVVPGWLKSARWTLKESMQFAADGTRRYKPTSRYLAIHEYESMESFSKPEFKTAISTPWRDKILPGMDREVDERRNFTPRRAII